MKDCSVTQTKRLRQPLFDIVKAIMMIWVIWGHLGLYGIVPPYNSAYPYMVNAKIGVNMPIFFVISGYFAAFTFAKSSLAKCAARSCCMIWPQIVYALLCASAVGLLTEKAFAWVFWQIVNFWFLRCIAVIYFVSACVFIFVQRDKLRWLMFGVFYLTLLFWPTRFHFWWMGQLIHMLPYFVFGLMVLSRHDIFKRNWVSILCGLLFVSAILLEGDSSTNGMNFWKVTAHWRVVLFNLRDFVTFFARTIVGIAGSVFVLWLIDKCLSVFPAISQLAVFGTTSLGVYVIHEWLIMMAGPRISVFPLPEWSRWITAIAYFLICHFVIVLVKRNQWAKMLMFGNEKRLTAFFEKVKFKIS